MKKNIVFIVLLVILSTLVHAQKNPVPLPHLKILPDQQTQSLSDDTKIRVNSLIDPNVKPTIEELRPHIFSEDVARTNHQLSLIVENYFTTQKWEESETELRKFLLINREEMVTARANFYLGQTLYYARKYENALYAFLETMDFFPAQSNLWIQNTLYKISKSTE